MEKSISNRFYFDYNATSPVANKVKDFLAAGDFLFGNPASIHSTGKKSKKYINETSDYLFDFFSLNKSDFNLIYHSGATEGNNLFFKGLALESFSKKEKMFFFFSTVDHASVVNQKEDLELLGHSVYFFEVDKDGNFEVDKLIASVEKISAEGKKVAINYTYVNNENGVVWPLERALKIKKTTNAIVHVDAVQLIGKYPETKLMNELDAYTFSGHKFGSLKGIGFTFIKKDLLLRSLIKGGNQQAGYRAGTENALSIFSLKLALEEFVSLFNSTELDESKKFLEKGIIDIINDKGEIVAYGNKNRNLNTIFVLLYNAKADLISAKFDLNNIDVSMGSACSSGIIKENRILISMGYNKEVSKSAIRFSFSPYMDKSDAKKYLDKIEPVLKSLEP